MRDFDIIIWWQRHADKIEEKKGHQNALSFAPVTESPLVKCEIAIVMIMNLNYFVSSTIILYF